MQTPGCVQVHGALLVVRADSTIVQASENCEAVLGHAAPALLGAPVARVLGDAGLAALRALIEQGLDQRPAYVTSLGLSTAEGIVSQSSGRIEAESEPGRGTKIRVFLPLA